MSIQDLYSLAIAILVCSAFVSTKSTAKMVDNKINQKKGQCLTSDQGCGNQMQIKKQQESLKVLLFKLFSSSKRLCDKDTTESIITYFAMIECIG